MESILKVGIIICILITLSHEQDMCIICDCYPEQEKIICRMEYPDSLFMNKNNVYKFLDFRTCFINYYRTESYERFLALEKLDIRAVPMMDCDSIPNSLIDLPRPLCWNRDQSGLRTNLPQYFRSCFLTIPF